MKSSIYGLIIISLNLISCSNSQKSSKVTIETKPDTNTTRVLTNDSILEQQFVDSLLSTVVWENPLSHIGYLGLNGRIIEIEYTINGDGFSLPFNTILFDENGMIISANGHYDYNCILEDSPNSKFLRLGVDGAGLGIEFNMVSQDKKSVFESYDEMGSARYTFSRNSNNEISNLKILYQYYPQMDSNECEESSYIFRARVNSYDRNNNWTSITFLGDSNTTTITRNITYLDNPKYIKHFKSNTGDKILFKYMDIYNSDFSYTDTQYLRIYDCTTKRWQSLIPPIFEMKYEPFDFRLIDNNLYLIYYTGSILMNTVCVIYLYDMYNNKWTELAWGEEGCSFEGNRIKVPRRKIIKYGDCSANNEWEEVIDWIEL